MPFFGVKVVGSQDKRLHQAEADLKKRLDPLTRMNTARLVELVAGSRKVDESSSLGV